MKQFLTISELSIQTALEESLIRFYESEYPEDLPEKVLQGNTLYFDIKAIDVLKMVHNRHNSSPLSETKEIDRSQNFARVIAITSGKGGVGKTNLALNLAIEFQRMGKMCLVLDADLGMANVHLLAGVQPRYTIQDILYSDIKISDVIMEGPEGIGIVPGGAGVMALADSTTHERAQMITALGSMESAADIIIVDTGAGMSSGVRGFLHAADEVLFVLTPDITSMADAYGLLKALCQEESNQPIYSVVNMAQSLRQSADVALRFSGCAEQFLKREVINVGYLLKDATVGAATAHRTPYTVFEPQSRVSKNTRNLAIALLNREEANMRHNSAFNRYMKMVRHG